MIKCAFVEACGDIFFSRYIIHPKILFKYSAYVFGYSIIISVFEYLDRIILYFV